MGHFIDPHGKIYVDTDFINRVQRLPRHTVNHLGFGEFELDTPDGKVEFDRMRGEEFPGQSGRSHAFYDSNGSQSSSPIAHKVIHEMEQHHFSEAAAGSKTATMQTLSLEALAAQLLADLNGPSDAHDMAVAAHESRAQETPPGDTVESTEFTPPGDDWHANYGRPLNRNDNTVIASKVSYRRS